tara:strand:- start:182 stop:307 length:126 start_codon:yes stop_codon:yes gene_type:complete
MTLTILSIATLGIIIIGVSVWWFRTTLNEGNKALKENQTKN